MVEILQNLVGWLKNWLAEKQRHLEQRKMEEIQQKKAQAMQELLDAKRYFSACFLDFFLKSQGDIYEIFPHKHCDIDSFSSGGVLDVRTKVRTTDKGFQKRLEELLIADFKVCEENFWRNFATVSNGFANGIDQLNQQIEFITFKYNKALADGTLTSSAYQQNTILDKNLRDKCDLLQKELKLRWEIWDAHFFISKLAFSGGFLEFQIVSNK